jgi:hypothetical protein
MLSYELVDALEKLLNERGIKCDIQGQNASTALCLKEPFAIFKKKQPTNRNKKPLLSIWQDEAGKLQINYWHR